VQTSLVLIYDLFVKVSVAYLSMEGQKVLRFHQKDEIDAQKMKEVLRSWKGMEVSN